MVGSINMDLVASVSRLPAAGETILGRRFATVPGGKGANQAVAAARLGGHVTMIGRLGQDDFAGVLREGLQAEGIDVAAVSSVPGPSGTAVILVDDAGANSIVVIAGANGALQPEDLEPCRSQLAGASLVLAQLEVPLATVERLAELCRELGTPMMLDPAPAQPLRPSLLRNVAWLTPNESETETLLRSTGTCLPQPFDPAAAAEELLKTGARNVVLKLGSRGVFLQGADVTPTQISATTVMPVDTTAAGDCFNAAFAVALAEGRPAAAAARFACAAAALSTTVHGAQPSMPTRQQVEQMLNQPD